MNLYSTQSWKTAAELQHLASTRANLKSGQNGRLLVSIHQDAMTGGYLLTKPRMKPLSTVDHQLPKALRKICHGMDNSQFQKYSAALRYNYYKKLSREDFYYCCMALEVDVVAKLAHIDRVYRHYGLAGSEESDFYNGHNLFSMLLPDDYEYNNFVDSNNWVVITCGVMICGTLCKSVLGDSQSSVIHSIEKEYSSQRAMDLVSRYQFLINDFLLHMGFSVGLEDCFLSTQVNITESIDKAFLEANTIFRTEQNTRLRESKIANALNGANSIGQKLCKTAVPQLNAFRAMIESGSKGSYVNIAQIMGLIGQQNYSGERIPRTYGLGKATPHCLSAEYCEEGVNGSMSSDIDILHTSRIIFRGRGFIESSYISRLHPLEVFFHTVCGREAVAASAGQTSSTGYSQRKLIKCMEDLSWTYADTVTNAKDQIISFNYGQTNLEPSKLIHVNKILQCIDIGRIADRLNRTAEFAAGKRALDLGSTSF